MNFINRQIYGKFDYNLKNFPRLKSATAISMRLERTCDLRTPNCVRNIPPYNTAIILIIVLLILKFTNMRSSDIPNFVLLKELPVKLHGFKSDYVN